MAKKNRSSTIAKTVFFIFALYASFTLISLQIDISKKRNEINGLSDSIAEQRVRNDALSTTIENSMQDDNIAQIAREKLGYVSPGERVFVDTSSN